MSVKDGDVSALEQAEEQFFSLPEVEGDGPDDVAGGGEAGEGGEGQPAAAPPWWQGQSQEAIDAELKSRFLDAPIPATADYPAFLHGRPMRDLVRSQFIATQKITAQGQENAALQDRLRVQDAMQQVLLRQFQGNQSALPQNQPAPTPPAGKGIFAKYGIDPMREFLADPEVFFERLSEATRREAEESIDGRVKPLEDTAAEARMRQELLGIRNASDQARDYIMRERGITDLNAQRQFIDSWDRRKEFMAHHAGGHSATPFNPRSWYDAHSYVEAQVGGFAPVMPGVVPRGENAAGAGNPPSSVRTQSMGSGTRARASKATSRQRTILADMLKDSGMDMNSDKIRAFRENVEAELGDAVEKGVYRA